MKKNQGLANGVLFLIIALVIFVGAGAYVVGKNSSRPMPSPQAVQPLISESELLAKLKADWKTVQAAFPDRPGHPGTTDWNGPYAVAFIGNNNLVIQYEDGYIANTGIIKYNNGQFIHLESVKNVAQFTASQWSDLMKKYADPAYPTSFYALSVVRNKEVMTFQALTKVPENIFLKNYAAVSPTPEDAAITTIQLPVVSIGTGTGTTGFGCNDKIVYIPKIIPKTTTPLNATLTELFALPQQVESYYNVFAKLKGLYFSKAELENGIAKIYLSGSFAGLGGVCDDPRPQAQLTAAAKQFSTVASVEIYLDNRLWVGMPGESGLVPALGQNSAYILARNAWGDCAITKECAKTTVTAEKKSGTWYVTAVYEGLHDDSVAATKKVSAAYYDTANGTWSLSTYRTTQRCWPGRGHQDFSEEPCI